MNADIGLLHLWNQGDFVTRAVAVILLAMSLSSWIVILVKALDLQRHARQSRSIAMLLACLGLRGPVHPFRHRCARHHER